MPARRASGPWLYPTLLTYTTILPKYPVACLQRKFGQGPSPLISTHRMIIHGDAMNMYWDQGYRMGKFCLSGCKSLGDLNI